jgi:hypothetical protein
MAQYKIPVSALRPAWGPLSKMVGTPARDKITQYKSGMLTTAQAQLLLAESLEAIQDQIDAINKLARIEQQYVQGEMCRAMAYQSGAQSIPDNTYTALTFGTNQYNVGGVHSTSVNPTRFIAPVAGVYDLIGQVSLVGTIGTSTELTVRLNGSGAISPVADHTLAVSLDYPTIQVHQIVELAVGQYVEFLVNQVSGGAVNTDPGYTWGSLVYRGPLS